MHDAVYVLRDALVQSQNPDEIKKFLYTVKDSQGVAGTLTLDKNGNPLYEYVLRTIKDGKPSVVE